MIVISLGKDLKIRASNNSDTIRLDIKLDKSDKWISKILDDIECCKLAFIIKVLYGLEKQ